MSCVRLYYPLEHNKVLAEFYVLRSARDAHNTSHFFQPSMPCCNVRRLNHGSVVRGACCIIAKRSDCGHDKNVAFGNLQAQRETRPPFGRHFQKNGKYTPPRIVLYYSTITVIKQYEYCNTVNPSKGRCRSARLQQADIIVKINRYHSYNKQIS